jgi:hypothetical protein
MNHTIQELEQIVKSYADKFNSMSDIEFSAKPHADKWSKKQVVGHMIDSAQNNLRRFICGQYESTPPKIVYDQNFWVEANGYQNTTKEDVIMQWKLINLSICSVLRNMSPENYSKVADTERDKIQLHSLEWLAADYVRHLKHHVNQVIPKSFDVVYS